MDWNVTACFASYVASLDALRSDAEARGVTNEPGADAAIRRFAWAVAQEAYPAPRTSVAYRCHQAGVPLPPRGRPPLEGVLVLPPVAVRRSGTALFDEGWAERVAQRLESRHRMPPAATGKPLPAHVIATYAQRALRRANEAVREPEGHGVPWFVPAAAAAAAAVALATHLPLLALLHP